MVLVAWGGTCVRHEDDSVVERRGVAHRRLDADVVTVPVTIRVVISRWTRSVQPALPREERARGGLLDDDVGAVDVQLLPEPVSWRPLPPDSRNLGHPLPVELTGDVDGAS